MADTYEFKKDAKKLRPDSSLKDVKILQKNTIYIMGFTQELFQLRMD